MSVILYCPVSLENTTVLSNWSPTSEVTVNLFLSLEFQIKSEGRNRSSQDKRTSPRWMAFLRPQTQLCWFGLFLYISYRAMDYFNFSFSIMMSPPLCHSQEHKRHFQLFICQRSLLSLCILHQTSHSILPLASSNKSLKSRTGSASWRQHTCQEPEEVPSVSLGRLITPQPGWHTGVWHSCCTPGAGAKPRFSSRSRQPGQSTAAFPVLSALQDSSSQQNSLPKAAFIH